MDYYIAWDFPISVPGSMRQKFRKKLEEVGVEMSQQSFGMFDVSQLNKVLSVCKEYGYPCENVSIFKQHQEPVTPQMEEVFERVNKPMWAAVVYDLPYQKSGRNRKILSRIKQKCYCFFLCYSTYIFPKDIPENLLGPESMVSVLERIGSEVECFHSLVSEDPEQDQILLKKFKEDIENRIKSFMNKLEDMKKCLEKSEEGNLYEKFYELKYNSNQNILENILLICDQLKNSFGIEIDSQLIEKMNDGWESSPKPEDIT